jgi:hypothetical protein
MHGSLFLCALHNLLLCADLRPDPVIVTIRCASFIECGGFYLSQATIITTWVMIFITFISTCDLLYIWMIHDLHTCSELHVNLEFSCLLTIRIHPLSHFQLLNLLFLSILFVTHCLIFIYIDSIHPVWLGKKCQCRSSCGSLLPFSINLFVFVYTHASVGVFTRSPFYPIPPGGFNFSADGRSTCGLPGCISRA